MKDNIDKIIDKLERDRSLSLEEYECLIRDRDEDSRKRLQQIAVAERQRVYDNAVYIRGLI